MDKLNPAQIQDVLKDVRASYRLLALYQKRLIDIVKYIANGYGLNFKSGWAKFSNPASHGNRASIDKWSWDWLTMYLYEFYLGELEIGEDKFYFKVVHQADTGFYDAIQDKKIGKNSIDQFGDVSSSTTRLFFVLSKNEKGCPMQHILNGHLTAKDDTKIINENWLAVPFDMIRFSNQESTDVVLKEFNAICNEIFEIELMENDIKTDEAKNT